MKIHLPMKETQEARVPSLDGDDPWRGKWQLAPVFLPGKCYGQRTLGGCSAWGLEESDMTE